MTKLQGYIMRASKRTIAFQSVKFYEGIGGISECRTITLDLPQEDEGLREKIPEFLHELVEITINGWKITDINKVKK